MTMQLVNTPPQGAEVARPEATPRPVTPSIHPDLIESRGVEGELNNLIELKARAALTEARVTLEQLARFEADARNDPTLTDDARSLSIYDASQKATGRALSILGPFADQARGHVAASERELHDAAKPSASARAFDAEVRAHVAKLDDAKRSQFVMERVNAGDTATVEALLSAPHFLSGVAWDVDTVKELRERTAGAAHPDKLEHLQRARAVERKAFAAFVAATGLVPQPDARLENLKARAQRRTASGRAIGV